MTRIIRNILVCLCSVCMIAPSLGAQNNDSTSSVVISQDKVNSNGKLYYSHVVLNQQTLYSISKAYGVTIQEIYDSNPQLNLEKDGLKAYQIILIPVNEKTEDKPQESGEDYIVHVVKWFEILPIIAKKYNISKEEIIKANNLPNGNLEKGQRLRIPIKKMDTVVPVAPAEDIVEQAPVPDEEETIEKESPSPKTGKVNASLILPFNIGTKTNDNSLDFYSGVLLAVKKLADEGISTDLSVYDITAGGLPVTVERMEKSDVILGPVSVEDISRVSEICPSGQFIISPLEQKAAELANTQGNLIQAPSPTITQSKELVRWLKEEYKAGDKVIVFTEKNGKKTENDNTLLEEIASSGLEYSTISYGLLEEKAIVNTLSSRCSQSNRNHIVIASESEAFANDVIRNTSLMVHRKYDMALYCPSKIRSYDTIEVGNFHSARMHVCIGYFVDYSSSDVQKFLLQYRALFNTEPGPFAFQGYDTAFWSIKAASMYGERWTRTIEGQLYRGLQSDFKAETLPSGSMVNTVVRRVLYDTDLSIKLVN